MFKLVTRLLNGVIVIGIFMGVFGWVWLPNMLNGTLPGPYSLLIWYVISIPIIIGIALAFLFFLFIYRFVLRLMLRGGEDATSLTLRNGMARLLIVTIVAGFPGYMGNFEAMQQEPFGGRYYQLLMQHNNSHASFSVFNCFEPLGVWCRSELQTPRLAPPLPTPTPLSDVQVVVNDRTIVIRPPLLPTPTPPAELLLDTTGVGLLLRVGAEYAVVTTIEPTPTVDPLLLTPLPEGTLNSPPKIIITIAPSVTPSP